MLVSGRVDDIHMLVVIPEKCFSPSCQTVLRSAAMALHVCVVDAEQGPLWTMLGFKKHNLYSIRFFEEVYTSPNFDMDTKNCGLESVSAFKYGFGCLQVSTVCWIPTG